LNVEALEYSKKDKVFFDLSFTLLALLHGQANIGISIKFSGVPESLTFPLADDANQILSARIKGACSIVVVRYSRISG